jgi:Flp pilus assembly protein TadG
MTRRIEKIHARRWLPLLKRESGSSLVEYAIVFILLMTMLLGVTDFGRALYAYHFVSNAAREAARYASVRGSACLGSCTAANDASGVAGPFPDSQTATTDIQDFVKNVPAGINAAQLTTTPTWPNPNGLTTCAGASTYNAPGCTVEVQVKYVFQFSSTFVFKSTGLTMTSTSQEIITH